MTKLLESILDDDKDIEARIEAEANSLVRNWMLKYAWITTNKGIDKAKIDDFEIIDGVIYLSKKKGVTGVKFYEDVPEVPPYIRFGYVGKEFGLRSNDLVKDISHVFDEMEATSRKALYYVTIEGNKKLEKIPDFSKFDKIFCLHIINNPKLKVNVDELADTWVSLNVTGNKNKIDVQDIDKRYTHHILELDDYNNKDKYQ